MYTLKLKFKSLQKLKLIKNLLKIKSFQKNNKVIIKGNIIIPKKQNIYTVLRSPHINKKSREQFNFSLYKQTFYILNKNIYILINFLILIKKILPRNILLKTQILKN